MPRQFCPQLLGGLLESNPSYVRVMESMGLAAQFFDFLELEHANNNVHNIRLCRQIVAAGTMPIKDLERMQVGGKVGQRIVGVGFNGGSLYQVPGGLWGTGFNGGGLYQASGGLWGMGFNGGSLYQVSGGLWGTGFNGGGLYQV